MIKYSIYYLKLDIPANYDFHHLIDILEYKKR